MEPALIPPAKALIATIPFIFFSILIPAAGSICFIYIIYRRFIPLLKAAPDPRFDHIPLRLFHVIKIGLGQYRQPRYRLAGILHIMIFAGFVILSLRSISLVIIGFSPGFVFQGLGEGFNHIYHILKDYAATMVLIACIIAGVRRGIFRPKRYAVPEKYGHDHTTEALFVLALIAILMIAESLFGASLAAAQAQKEMYVEFTAPLSLAWFFKLMLINVRIPTLQGIHTASYLVHDLTFFFFLCFLPMGKHFHVITSLPNIFFMRLKKGNIKPVRYGVDEEGLDNLESFGVTRFEDFTWKNMLDFYTCADCGRCSDQCPANAVSRPLSPRFISIKARDYAFRHYPLFGSITNGESLIGDIYTEDEIWSCTTCGACEEECPLGIEYIDKIVDLRRSMVDSGNVPQSLQKPLRALEKRGNPWGKTENKRAAWIKDKEFARSCPVKVLGKKETAEVLYFVDSMTSFDERMQSIGRAVSKILTVAGIDFGILGKAEKDSGNEIRRFGEEMLFQELKQQNTDAIIGLDVKNIITSDPHAFNALKNDYNNLPPIEHISRTIIKNIRQGRLKLKNIEDNTRIYTYHDPCYLGRHNGIYDAPRDALDAIPGIKRVEMSKCRDRSFCCGGGGLMLFYEAEEEQRMGVLRVEMAKEAGANVIVTACPFCMAHIEDAIKVAGLENEMEVIDLSELIERHLII